MNWRLCEIESKVLTANIEYSMFASVAARREFCAKRDCGDVYRALLGSYHQLIAVTTTMKMFELCDISENLSQKVAAKGMI